MLNKAASPLLLALLLTGALGCESLALHDARLKDNPEAYLSFLKEYPDTAERAALMARIDELHFQTAVELGTADAFREYLQQHPTGNKASEARVAADQAAFSEAATAGTAQALQNYLEQHPQGSATKQASDLLDRILYRDRVSIAELRVEQINLGGKQDGPLDGWAVLANVINEGRRTLSLIELKIDLLNDTGEALGPDHTWWAVAPDLGAFPTPETMKPPLAPGSSRAFRWTTDALPEGWGKKAALRVSEVRFEY